MDLYITFLSVASQIRNGSTSSSPLIGRFCGRNLPSPIFPQSNELYLRFKSDVSDSREGFEATWTSSPHGENCLWQNTAAFVMVNTGSDMERTFFDECDFIMR